MSVVTEFLAGLAIKAGEPNAIPFPPWGTSSWFDVRPRQAIDLRKVGDGLSNSAAFGVVQSLATAYSEPPIREFEWSDGQWSIVENSPAAALLDEPNPHMELELLAAYEVAAIAATGSAFYHKLRNQLGQVLSLWPLYPAFMSPVTPQDGSEYQTGWEYQVPGGQKVIIPMEDVVHRRWAVDRTDHRKGWAPLREVLLEIMQDQEAARFSTSLLVNMGVPGVVLSPKDPDDPGPDDPAAVAQEFKSKFSGQKVGEPFVSSGSLDVQMVSFSPDQMDLSVLRRVPEERITAALQWPAILANLGAGLDRATYSNAGELREFATEQRLVPMWNLGGKQWTRQLLRDRSFGPPNLNRQLRFDLSDVRALAKDEKDEVDKMNVGVQGGWVSVAEARRVLDLPVVPTDEVYLRGVSQEAIPVGVDPTGMDDAEPPSDE